MSREGESPPERRKDMTITRPYNAEDNEYNLAMSEIIEHYASKQGEVIVEKEIYKYAVYAKTETGREFIATKANGCRSGHYNIRNYIYMKEVVNGKQKRIKKEEW